MYPRNMPCPTCGASCGLPCLNPWGYPIAAHHQARIDAASTK